MTNSKKLMKEISFRHVNGLHLISNYLLDICQHM